MLLGEGLEERVGKLRRLVCVRCFFIEADFVNSKNAATRVQVNGEDVLALIYILLTLLHCR